VLAPKAHLDLLGVARGTELVHGGQDAVGQLARRCFIDVLQYRYQRATRRIDLDHQQGIIRAVARQPRKVVDDHVGRPLGPDVLQHLLERGPPRGARTDAVLHELAGNGSAQLAGTPVGGLALPRDGVALRVSPAVHLALA
jgi:hypothetical protein